MSIFVTGKLTYGNVVQCQSCFHREYQINFHLSKQRNFEQIIQICELELLVLCRLKTYQHINAYLLKYRHVYELFFRLVATYTYTCISIYLIVTITTHAWRSLYTKRRHIHLQIVQTGFVSYICTTYVCMYLHRDIIHCIYLNLFSSEH